MRIYLLLLIFIMACSDQGGNDPGEISRLDEVAMENIFLDYRIHAEEGDDNLNILIQFRESDPDGRTLLVGDAGKVMLDEEELQADSTERMGAYYEIQKPIASFTGEHVLLLEGPGGKRFEERFRFTSMTLESGPGDTVFRNEELVLQLAGLEKKDYVRIVMTDTSFVNDGINRLDTVYNGRLVLPRLELEQLAAGPVHLELYRENERPTMNKTVAGGRFSLTYVLKRDFILSD
jgi:hypothetical protein